MSEEDFWNSTPAKIIALADVHININKASSKTDKKINTNDNIKTIELICLDDQGVVLLVNNQLLQLECRLNSLKMR